MNTDSRKTAGRITTWEAACVITGYGIGGGVLVMPYYAEKNGIIASLLILAVSFAASIVLHLMIADVVLKCDEGSQIISIFSKFIFRGRFRIPLKIIFFALMSVVLCANLSVYVSEAGEALCGMIPIPLIAAEIIFYAAAAAVVFFGLKTVAVSEKLTVTVIFVIIGIFAFSSLTAELHPLSMSCGTFTDALGFFGMAMFALSAFFSIPQAVEGLGRDKKKIKKAVILGLMNNFILIIVITFCSLAASPEVTEVAMTGWSRGIGEWAVIAGGIFTFLAILTTYWSLSLALADMVREQSGWNEKICWLLATIPSFILSASGVTGILGFLEIAAGAIAIIVAVMVVPTFSLALKEKYGGNSESLLGKFSGLPVRIIIVICYILMAVGNLI